MCERPEHDGDRRRHFLGFESTLKASSQCLAAQQARAEGNQADYPWYSSGESSSHDLQLLKYDYSYKKIDWLVLFRIFLLKIENSSVDVSFIKNLKLI